MPATVLTKPKRATRSTSTGLNRVATKKTMTQVEVFYNPETGERISRAGYYMMKIKAEGGGVKIMDMKAVLK